MPDAVFDEPNTPSGFPERPSAAPIAIAGDRGALAMAEAWLWIHVQSPMASDSGSSQQRDDGHASGVSKSAAPDLAYAEVVRRAHGVLKPLGFRKQGTSFTRVKGVSTQRIAFQKSAWRTMDDPIRFTLNLYLFVHELAPDADPAKPRLENFHYQSRIGSLLPADIDRWWEIVDLSDVDAVWSELEGAMVGPVQSWAEQATTTDGLLGCTPAGRGIMLVDLAAWKKRQLDS